MLIRTFKSITSTKKFQILNKMGERKRKFVYGIYDIWKHPHVLHSLVRLRLITTNPQNEIPISSAYKHLHLLNDT